MMGYDCWNTAKDISFSTNISGWSYLFDLAQEYGWEPAGTIPGTPDGEWEGGYFTNDQQIVTTEDAASMAYAIERAIAAGDGKAFREERLKEFVALCRAGSFEIW